MMLMREVEGDGESEGGRGSDRVKGGVDESEAKRKRL